VSLLKQLIKNCIPTWLLTKYRHFSSKGIRYVGHYSSWQEAAEASTGYDADSILEMVSVASVKVQSGAAAYERDSVLFDQVEHAFPLLAILMKVAADRQGRLNVLDFGGSLGSSYRQCKNFLPGNIKMNWCVVEQEKFVQRGREMFASDELQFFFSIEEVNASHKPDVVLLASVLQYLENPDQIVDAAIASEAEYIVIDRTLFVALQKNWLCIQQVPASIYKASYPCAMLSQSRLEERLNSRFECIAEFDAIGGKGYIHNNFQQIPFECKGMVWRKR
jgi:putative methyltransferase (TIGR04325 family)